MNEQDIENDGHAPMPVDGHFSDLAEADMSPPVWVIKNVLPAGITFIAGPPKTMKSTIEMAFSAAIAELHTDVLPPELLEVVLPGVVMGLSAEASAGELRHMVEQGMQVKVPDDKRIMIADDPWSFRLDDPEALETLLTWLNTRKPRLFWLDPLRDFHSLEERDSGAMNRLLRPIQKWAKENDSAFIVVHHTRKKSNDDKSDYDAGDMRGTTALFGIADGVIMISPQPNGRLKLKGTYKRGPEWEKVVILKLWGRGGDDEKEKLGEGVVENLSLQERQVLIVLRDKRKLFTLGYTVHLISKICKRLGAMHLVEMDKSRWRLTPVGEAVADEAKSLLKTGTPE